MIYTGNETDICSKLKQPQGLYWIQNSTIFHKENPKDDYWTFSATTRRKRTRVNDQLDESTIFVEERQQLMWELVAQVDEIWGSRGNMKLQISIGRAFT